jgi:glycosyltransferase A (GT-A) superfamily protein (DUF2064 family)
MEGDLLLVYARLPRRGEVKPFVALELGEEAAYRLQEVLLEVTLRHADPISAEKRVLYSPGEAGFEPPWGWDAEPQADGDIGTRLIRGFQEAFDEGAQRIVAIDCECPMVTPRVLETSFEILRGDSELGGYDLIGMRRPLPELFTQVPWGASTLLRSTLDRALALGITPALLPRLSNVDSAEDWQKAARQGWLPPPPAKAVPRTRQRP